MTDRHILRAGSIQVCNEAIVDLYERHARDFDRDRSRFLQEKAWLDLFLWLATCDAGRST